MPPICRCHISFTFMQPYRHNRPKTKSAETQPKIPAQKNSCDPLSPYVGIIQIRFRVKASAYSQPACASTPFFVFGIIFVMICFYNSFIIHACSQNASFSCINCCSSSVSWLPISHDTNPHCGLKYNLSNRTYFAACLSLLIRAVPALYISLCYLSHSFC